MKQNRNLKLAALVILLALACGPGATNALAQQGPPTEFEDSFTIEGICEFTVLVELSGKTKTIVLPGGRTLFTFPGEIVTLTNLDDRAKHETLSITGAIRERVLENGDVELVFTGRNLIIGFDPIAAFVITVGRFSVAFDDDFNVTQPLSGNGQLINVCELLD
ncbi:hypothetical protein BH20ACI3_BH20ACI3_23270 [soil metagenome]